MRALLIGATIVVAGCAASGPKDDSQPLTRACSVSTCFSEREVRDFEVIDKTTVIVYVGAQRCPFQIDLRGMACDMTFAPSISFRATDQPDTTRSREEQRQRSRGPIVESDIGANRPRALRVCSNDTRVGVDGGVFTEGSRSSETERDRFDNPKSLCEVNKIASLTDDQLIELLVDRKGFAPPPPMGGGQIQVSKQEEEGASESSPVDPAATPPTAPL